MCVCECVSECVSVCECVIEYIYYVYMYMCMYMCVYMRWCVCMSTRMFWLCVGLCVLKLVYYY